MNRGATAVSQLILPGAVCLLLAALNVNYVQGFEAEQHGPPSPGNPLLCRDVSRTLQFPAGLVIVHIRTRRS